MPFRELVGSYQVYDESALKSVTKLKLQSKDLVENWRRCSLTSDFIARYYSIFFPYIERSENTFYRQEAENIISFIMNELVENTAKYSDENGEDVDVWIGLDDDRLIFDISNQISHQAYEPFMNLCKELLESDPQELYIKKIEENIDSGTSSSGLGYLTLVNDYGVSFGFAFTELNDKLVKASVQAVVNYREENI